MNVINFHIGFRWLWENCNTGVRCSLSQIDCLRDSLPLIRNGCVAKANGQNVVKDHTHLLFINVDLINLLTEKPQRHGRS